MPREGGRTSLEPDVQAISGRTYTPSLTPTQTHTFAAMVRVAGTLAKSGEVMKVVNGLIRVPELAATMQQMSMGACSCPNNQIAC